MILIIGKGFIGTAIAQYLKSIDEPFMVATRDTAEFAHMISQCSAVINAAGYTGKPNVDACEKNKLDCMVGNVLLPIEIAKFCERFKKPMVHISSGCLYQGSKNYLETAPVNFDGSYYSFTKATAERALRGYDVRSMRIRMPFIDGKNPRCVLTKLKNYKKWIEGENSITYLPDIARAAHSLIKAPDGLYNVTNPGTVKNSELAKYMGMSPEWWDHEEFYMTHTPRSFCTLNSDKVQKYVKLENVHTILGRLYPARKAS